MFRVSKHPSSGVLKTVTAASGTGHNTGAATSLQRGLIGTFEGDFSLSLILSLVCTKMGIYDNISTFGHLSFSIGLKIQAFLSYKARQIQSKT